MKKNLNEKTTVNISSFFNKLFKYKYIFIIIPFLTAFISYKSFSFLQDIYLIEIKFEQIDDKFINKLLFKFSDSEIRMLNSDSEKKITNIENYTYKFLQKISSTNSVLEFLKNNSNDYGIKKLFLNEDEVKIFFSKNLSVVRRKEITPSSNNELIVHNDKIIFKFIKPIDGTNFLNDLIIYAFNNLFNEKKNETMLILKKKIEELDENLTIANDLNIDLPFIFRNNNFSTIFPNEMYLLGTRILNQKKINLENLLKKVINTTDVGSKNFINQIIHDGPNPKVIINKKSNHIYLLSGFIIGLFLSLLIIVIIPDKKIK